MWKDKEGGADTKVGQEASGTHKVNKVSQHSPQWIFQMMYFSGRGRKAC